MLKLKTKRMLKVKRFTAKWCGPCRQLAPVFTQIEEEMKDEPIEFQTIDVDEDRALAIEANVSSVPTILIEKDGQEVYRTKGALPKAVIIKNIKDQL